MTNSSDSDSLPENIPTNDINQKVGENQGLVVGQASGSTVIGSIHNYYHAPDISNKAETVPLVLGENPYKGLEAFEEEDRDRFFGRDTEIKGENGLLKKFQDLRDDQNAIRILPVYGASGSGKSSLVKAGLVPILRDGLKEGDRLVLMKPSGDPIGELAKVLAHNIIDKRVPVEEISDFKTWLLEQNEVLTSDGKKNKDFDGLHRIIDSAKGVKSLILVIDQFEEIYTYGTSQDQRDAFVYNLLCAANAAKYFSRKVLVILTMRIDFVGKTHEYSSLNKLFASPTGVYVPIMQREQLAIAISEPAKRLGYLFTEETVDLLLEQSQGQEGALPLLQFALTQIWEGLLTGIAPIETLRKIGGVGGALAKKAQEAYDVLKTDQEKQIARSIFLRLILLNDGNRATKCRVGMSGLLIDGHTEQLIHKVVEHFTDPKARILVTSAPIENPKLETVEISHEALIDNWEELKSWLNKNEKAKLQWQEIDRLSKKWESRDRSKDYLLQDRNLRDALEFQKSIRDSKTNEVNLSPLISEFIVASQKKKKSDSTKRIATIFIFPTLILTPLIFHFGTLFIANQIIYKKGCESDFLIDFFLHYHIDYAGKKEFSEIQLCNEYLRGTKLSKIIMINPVFETANLSNSNFHGATLINSNFKGASIAYSDFRDSLLMGSDFSCSDKNKTCSDLWGANFENSKLIDANFKKAFLEKTSFRKSDLTNANLDEAQYLTEEQLQGAILCQTTLPKYLSISGNRNCPKNK